MKKVLTTILKTGGNWIVGMAMLGMTAAVSYASYDLPELQELDSKIQSCSDVTQTFDYNNVVIDAIIGKYKQNGKDAIVVIGYIPTSNKEKLAKAEAIEREGDEALYAYANDIFDIAKKYGNMEESQREEKVKKFAESTKILVIRESRHDHAILHISPEVYNKDLAEQVNGDYAPLKGSFTIKGNVGCLTHDEYKASSNNLEAIDISLKSLEDFDRWYGKANYNDLLQESVGIKASPDDRFILYFDVTSIENFIPKD